MPVGKYLDFLAWDYSLASFIPANDDVVWGYIVER